MNVEVKVPSLGESISEATVSRILQPSGSIVARDQDIIELETDKVNQVLHAPEAGRLELSITVGQKVTIGQVIGSVDTSVQTKESPKEPAKEPIRPATPPPASSGPSARIMPEESALGKARPPPSAPSS